MRKLYSPKYFSWLLLLLSGAVGCHQEPALPASAIPLTCQIHRVENIDEGVRDTTIYTYTTFGHLEKSTYRQWINNLLVINTVQSFTYDDNHFLIAQVDQTTTNTPGVGQTQSNKTYTYTYLENQIQQVTINTSGQTLGYRKYGYENNKLKTYTEANGQNEAVLTYTYDGTGKLTQLTGPNAMSAVVTNGKITKKTFQDGTTVTYEFDNQGQLTKEITTAGSTQTVRTYEYDEAPYWDKTQLLLRGIPLLDLGSHMSIHNVKKMTIKKTQNSRIVQDQAFDYQRVYAKAGYTLGYARSDGARQNIIYAYCL